MRILHVAESIRGGCGTYLNQIVPQQITEMGAENIHVLIPAEHLAQIPDVPASSVSIFARQKRSARSLINLAQDLNRCINSFDPEIIHAHSTFAGAVTRILLMPRRNRPAIIYCPHGWVFDVRNSGWKQRFLERAEWLMSKLGDLVIAISDHEARQARRIGIPEKRIRVVSNGLRRESPSATPALWQDERLKALFVGRLDEQKGIDVLLKAVEPLADKVALRVVGESVLGTDSLSTQQQSNVEYLGWLTESEIQGQLNAADVVVMPSRWEGFGLVAIEAMRAGKAVIASRVGGLPEVVAEGHTGILFPSEDVEALRIALLGVDEDTLVRFGANGRRRFEELFTIERTHSGLMQLYRELTQPKRAVAEPRNVEA